MAPHTLSRDLRVTMESLPDWLRRELADHPTGGVIHAGHYAVESSSGWPVDHLESPDAAPSPLNEFAHFARVTWELACRAIADTPSADTQLVTLVNDWQFVRTSGLSRRKMESLTTELRASYYRKYPELPPLHKALLAKTGLTPNHVFRASSERWLFSERILRDALARTVKHLVERNDCHLRVEFTDEGEPIVKANSEAGEFNLLYCGNTNCAGEMVELLRQLHERGVRFFVNLYPETCLGPVTTGTLLAYDLFELKGMMVANVAIPLDVHALAGKEPVRITRYGSGAKATAASLSFVSNA